MRHVVLLLSVGFAVACPFALRGDEEPRAELKRFQGTWLYESQESDGLVLAPKAIQDIWVVVDGDVMTKTGTAGGGQRYKIVLDPRTTPKSIDLVSHHHPSGLTFHMKGIYTWDENGALRLCLDSTGQVRPTTFSAPRGQKDLQLSVLLKKKTDKADGAK